MTLEVMDDDPPRRTDERGVADFEDVLIACPTMRARGLLIGPGALPGR